MYPQYECKDGQFWKSCERSFICDNELRPNKWRFDYEHEESYINWVESLRLTCMDEKVISMIGGSFFVGMVISSIVIPRYSEIYGRQISLFWCICVQSTAYCYIFYSKDIYHTIMWFLIVGLCAGGRNFICLQYVSELVPQEYKTHVITLL